jgi:type IV secretion system protein VirD4
MTSEEQKLYAALAGIAATVLALIWLNGALAGLLFGAGWTPIRASELLATALRLPFHLGEPRLAWPREARAALPSTAGFYVCTGLIVILLSALALGAWRALGQFEPPRLGGEKQRPPNARWANRRDLAPLRVPKAQPARLTLGRSGRSLLAAEERQSAIVFAPTGTYKTSGLAIPALLEWQGPVLVTSIKGDLLAETHARREKLGEVMVFDPAQVSGKAASQVNPLLKAGTWRGAMQVAHWLCAAARTRKGGLSDADFWFATAEKLLAPMLFAAASSGRTMGAIVRWLDEGPDANQDKVEEALGKAEEPEVAKRAWQATLNRDFRQRASVYTTAEMVVAAFADERVIAETTFSDYTPEALLDGEPNTLYLCAPRHEQERLSTLFAMIVQELLAVAYERALEGGPLDPPLLLLLDEAANIAPIPDLDEIASSGAGQGVQLLSIFQDMAQVKARYGGRAATIINNHRAKLFGTGVSDLETLSYVSRVVGPGQFAQKTRNTQRGQSSTTEGKTYRDLAPASVVRGRDPGTALLVYGHLPPAKIRLRPWFQNKGLRALQKGPSGIKAETKQT